MHGVKSGRETDQLIRGELLLLAHHFTENERAMFVHNQQD